MGTSILREKRRVHVLMALSIAFAASFLASFISQTVELARLEAWRAQLELDLRSLDRQRAELQAAIALRDTDEWLGQAAIEAGYMPPNALALVTVDATEATDAPGVGGEAMTISPGQPAPIALAVQPGPEAAPVRSLWNNPNWRAWRRLFTGRP
jgi:hypothetical protein